MRNWWSCLAGVVGLLGTAAQAADCKLSVVGLLKTDPAETVPVIEATINGHAARLLADTGADETIMWRDQALKLGVPLGNVLGAEMYGVGGRAPVQTASIDNMVVGGAKVHNMTTLVVGSPSIGGLAMAIGNQFFAQTDVAFDLPENKILMLQEHNCQGPDLIFWNKPYSQVSYRSADAADGAIYVTVMLNGRSVDAQIDSGASATIIDENLARSLGAEDVAKSAGTMKGGGVGFAPLDYHLARFKSFALGDESIQNVTIQAAPLMAKVSMSETGTRLGSQSFHDSQPRMLLGADFLRAHQLLISRPHAMIYFSYAGGAVFDVRHGSNRRTPAAAEPSAANGTAGRSP